MTTLDSFRTPQPTTPNKSISQAEADYLYENSYEMEIERRYDWLIQQKLAEEKQENDEKMRAHSNYVKNNYIRIGGN